MKIKQLIPLIACLALQLAVQAQNLWQPYYISPRTDAQHQSLDGDWQLGHRDAQISALAELEKLDNWIDTKVPVGSVHWSYFLAGELPDMYKHLNSKKYEWIEDATWYYKRTFDAEQTGKGNYALLCFDGLDYFSRVWLNGELLGSHEGLYGGPAVEVSEILKPKGNELVVEARSGKQVRGKINKSPYFPKNVIKGWEFTGGSGAEPFYTVGMWQGVRIEYVPKAHLERPFLITNEIERNTASLQLKAEILVNITSLDYDLHPENSRDMWGHPSHGKHLYDHYLSHKADSTAMLKFVLKEKDKTVVSKEWEVELYQGKVWVNENFELENPKLWWPNGMGEANLYQAILTLEVNGKQADEIQFDYGIRTIETESSAGSQVGDTWDDWQFVINGEKLFIKGINWMPADVLMHLPKEKYEWILRLAKDAGIQAVRIWGSGLIETEAFYNTCNELGIMVWAEYSMANWDAPEFPQDVYESQVLWSIFRLRNHPSLLLHSGGNEYNPYSEANSALTGILERSVRFFDGTRPYRSASPDGGSIHTYPDWDPTWYKRKYKHVPYIAETGMHSIPEPAGLKRIIDNSEFQDLGNMYSEDFVKDHPDFIHHFVEFNPQRVPRMLSRASHIADMKNPTLESISEASQISAGEFYQIVSEQTQANYPTTTGLMPWVFKRPWPIVSAIHLVDGFGQPSAPYYFLKRTYEPTHVGLDIDWLLWKAGEKFPVNAIVSNSKNGFEGKVEVVVYDDQFKECWKKESAIRVAKGPSVSKAELGIYPIPETYKLRFFLMEVSLKDVEGKVISKSHYWPRTLPQMETDSFYTEYRNQPMAWPTQKEGPWLKPTLQKSKTKLSAKILNSEKTSVGQDLEIEVSNMGKLPSFMTKIDVLGRERQFVCDDNFFWLSPGETRKMKIRIRWGNFEEKAKKQLVVGGWNSNAVRLKL